jgi:Rad3-related DNA helicase
MPTFPDYARFLLSLGSTKFRTLWDAQSYVLREYVARFSDKPDVAIELPTGTGKTLIALLVAEIWRRSNSKVAVLSANNTLARQVLREAEELRIPAVLMEGSRWGFTKI